jgi:hypothetical protein
MGAAIGRSARTARSLLQKMRDVGALTTKRGGPGRTASWIFCIGGAPIFGTGATAKLSPTNDSLAVAPRAEVSAQERQEAAGLDRQKVADKPFEPDPIEHKPSPLPPSEGVRETGPAQGPVSQPTPTPRVPHEGGLTGEVLPPESEITFDEFWKAIRREPGKTGPALAAWRKLSRDDRRAISDLIGPNGIDMDGMWAAVWLAQRRWECAPLKSSRSEWQAAHDELHAFVNRTIVDLKPYSTEWTAERDRRIAAGESVKLMDTWARDGRGWACRSSAASPENADAETRPRTHHQRGPSHSSLAGYYARRAATRDAAE